MPTIINLSTLGSQGFVLEGELPYDTAGWSVSSAGDVNGDGIEDLIVGAPASDAGGSNSGSAYVVYGKTAPVSGRIDLGTLGSADGFIIRGDSSGDRTGFSVSSAGDLNGDGVDDIIVGAPQYAAGLGNPGAGAAYVIFGQTGERATLDLGGAHTAEDYIVIGGDEVGDVVGVSVSDAGDFNGDGFDDIVIGARFADTTADDAGKAYVLFGHAGAFADIPDLGGRNGRYAPHWPRRSPRRSSTSAPCRSAGPAIEMSSGSARRPGSSKAGHASSGRIRALALRLVPFCRTCTPLKCPVPRRAG
ncbi:MAG TPA: integrin alpha [Allosphingosinicella sp.]